MSFSLSFFLAWGVRRCFWANDMLTSSNSLLVLWDQPPFWLFTLAKLRRDGIHLGLNGCGISREKFSPKDQTVYNYNFAPRYSWFIPISRVILRLGSQETSILRGSTLFIGTDPCSISFTLWNLAVNDIPFHIVSLFHRFFWLFDQILEWPLSTDQYLFLLLENQMLEIFVYFHTKALKNLKKKSNHKYKLIYEGTIRQWSKSN